MNERLHAYLDGEMDGTTLSSTERAELAALQATISGTVWAIRLTACPDLTGRVMGELPQAAPQPDPPVRRWRSALAWAWRPWHLQLQLRPAYVLAAIATLLLLSRVPFTSPAPDISSSPPAPVGVAVYVQFRLDAAGASRVALAGTFTGWEPRVELIETAPGTWSATIPLKPGVHDYTFLVDGERWVPDPHAAHIPDSFGGTNSRIALLPPSTRT